MLLFVPVFLCKLQHRIDNKLNKLYIYTQREERHQLDISYGIQ
jgi:hypothetical protein